jgi:fatty acid-binding protein DegV
LQNYNSYKYYLSVLNKDYKQGKSLEEIAKKINKTPEEIKTILSIFKNEKQ